MAHPLRLTRAFSTSHNATVNGRSVAKRSLEAKPMPPFRHILFPVDFSERCRAVRPFVGAVVRELGARLTLLHVIQVPQGFYGGVEVAYPITLDIEAMERDGERLLRQFVRESDLSALQHPEMLVKICEPAAEI